MKKIILAIGIVLILLSYFAAQNHYLCGSTNGSETRSLEKEAKQLPKYPGYKKYKIATSCGEPDGVPSATIEFYTPDSEDKVFNYYTNLFEEQGQKITTKSNDSLCTQERCVNYDPRQNRADGYKWWNVDISFIK